MLKFDWNFLFVIINLVIFYLLMRKFVFGRVMATMDKRKELIQRQFDDAQQANDDALQLKNDYQAQLDQVDNEKKEIINKARAEAKIEYNKILDKAERDADKVVEDAHKAAELDAQQIKKSANEEIAQLAMETAQKIIMQNVSADSDSQLYDKFLEGSSED